VIWALAVVGWLLLVLFVAACCGINDT